MRTNLRRHYSSFIWPFESGIFQKGRGRDNKKLNISKSFLDEIKSIFHNFWNAFFRKNIKKIEGTSFNIKIVHVDLHPNHNARLHLVLLFRQHLVTDIIPQLKWWHWKQKGKRNKTNLLSTSFNNMSLVSEQYSAHNIIMCHF